jgi:CheY-like chemotaxis protein
MLTSGTRPGDFDRCKELGVAAHLIKPIKQSELFDAIVAALGADQAIVESDADDAPTIRYTPRHILLAEDSVVNQKLAVGLLARHQHDVTVVNNGREAIDALRRQSFDLVLMDVQMPELDGLEATNLIRQHEKQTGGRIPIIAMTAHAMAGDRERCLEAGMDDYIAKPVRAADLFAKIAAWSGGNARTGTGDDETADDGGSDPAQVVHWDEALAAVAGDRTLLREVVGAFLSETNAMIESIEKAIDTGDAPVVRRSAHTIKGTLRLLGARAALAKAEQLEFMGRDERLADAPAVFSQLSQELQKLRPVLVAFTDEDDMLGNE